MRLLFTLCTCLAGIFSWAQGTVRPISPGSICVVRVGSPDSVISNRSREVFIHEYDTATGALLQVIALPSSGTGNKLTLQGTSSSEGGLRRSVNKAYLVIGGYDLNIGVSSPSSTATAAHRTIARIGIDGVVDVGTKVAATEMHPNGQVRQVATVDGSAYWTAGGSNGHRYVVHGATTTTLVSNTVTNQRGVGIFDNQLYACHASGTAISRVNIVGNGLPTTTGNAATNLPGIPANTAPTITAADFVMLDLSEAVPGLDVLYVADEAAGGGIVKYSLVGGTWVENSRTGTGDANNYRQMDAQKMPDGRVAIFVNRNSGAQLAKLFDAGGYNAPISGSLVTLATAETNTAFRGVAFGPEGDRPTPVTFLSISAARSIQGNTISWTVTQETNLAHYQLEKSSDGQKFTQIAQVLPAVNGRNLQYTYQWLDGQTSPGTTYYRVRSTNNDGTSALSKVVALQPTTASGLQAWPNPATQSWVQISHPAATSTRASLRVVGMQGAVLMQVPVAKGSVTTLVNLGSQAAGMYRIVFTDGTSRQQLPLVVK